MTGGWPAAALGAGLILAALSGRVAIRRAPARLMVSNYVGRSVPRVVGICLVGSSVAGFWLGAALAGRTGRLDAFDVAVVSAAIGLGGVGLLDDLFGGEARGLAGHLRSLLRGRPTTGILKLLAGIAGGAVIAWLAGGSLLRIVAGAVLISVGGNIWNALDVVPGRALKWGGLALAALLPAVWGGSFGLLAAATLGAVIGALPVDLGERGMLGDTGSNPLGFLVGTGLFLVLPTSGVLAAAAAGLVLQLAAETVTISRLIDAVPPLRWVDSLGRSTRPAGSSAKVKSRGD